MENLNLVDYVATRNEMLEGVKRYILTVLSDKNDFSDLLGEPQETLEHKIFRIKDHLSKFQSI